MARDLRTIFRTQIVVWKKMVKYFRVKCLWQHAIGPHSSGWGTTLLSESYPIMHPVTGTNQDSKAIFKRIVPNSYFLNF